MPQKKMGLIAVLGLSLLAACSHSAIPAKTSSFIDQQQGVLTASAADSDSGDADTAAPTEADPAVSIAVPDSTLQPPGELSQMQEPVMITLKEEPRLHAPIATVVAPTDQTYVLTFKEAMQRTTVEQALRTNAGKRATELEGAVTPDFRFNWENEQLLTLTVAAPKDSAMDYGGRSYVLDVSGAKTLTGSTLQEAPSFNAIIYSSPQLWRISTDGKQQEQLHTFAQPYFNLTALDSESRYFLLDRFGRYCECDADHERIHAIFDREEQKVIPYPLELTTNYKGPGRFAVDTRGFFYPITDERTVFPSSKTALTLTIDNYIHGASLSKDRQYLLMAQGSEQQKQNFDLVIRHLASGKEQRFPQALQGFVPFNELSGEPAPISFQDDGKQVTFYLLAKQDEWIEQRYQYSWQTGKISGWNPQVRINSYSGYTASDDGAYQLFANAGLYRGQQVISDQLHSGMWIPGTHHFVEITSTLEQPDSEEFTNHLVLYDADQQVRETTLAILPANTQLLSISPDGKWMYLQSPTRPEKIE